MSNLTDPYWRPPPHFLYNQGITQNNRLENDLGFRNSIPVGLPVTIGEGYFGSNEGKLNLPKQLVFTTQGEYFAPGNTIPMTGNYPLVNIYNSIYTFKRSDHIQKI
jgi:hypothetical protein